VGKVYELASETSGRYAPGCLVAFLYGDGPAVLTGRVLGSVYDDYTDGWIYNVFVRNVGRFDVKQAALDEYDQLVPEGCGNPVGVPDKVEISWGEE